MWREPSPSKMYEVTLVRQASSSDGCECQASIKYCRDDVSFVHEALVETAWIGTILILSLRLLLTLCKSETGRKPFRRARSQTPNSLSFFALSEFRGENSVSSSRPSICVTKHTHRVFRRTHWVCPKIQRGSVSSLLRNSTLDAVFRPCLVRLGIGRSFIEGLVHPLR